MYKNGGYLINILALTKQCFILESRNPMNTKSTINVLNGLDIYPQKQFSKINNEEKNEFYIFLFLNC